MTLKEAGIKNGILLKNGTTKASFIGWKDYQLQANRIALINNKPTAVSEKVDGDDTIYFDGQTTQKVISDLNELQSSNTPLFMAVGYVKPHLPLMHHQNTGICTRYNNINLPVNHTFPESVPKLLIINGENFVRTIISPKKVLLMTAWPNILFMVTMHV